MRLLTPTLYVPAGVGSGSRIYIPADRITAAHEAHFNADARRWRAVVHLVGGERIPVCEEAETMMLEVMR